MWCIHSMSSVSFCSFVFPGNLCFEQGICLLSAPHDKSSVDATIDYNRFSLFSMRWTHSVRSERVWTRTCDFELCGPSHNSAAIFEFTSVISSIIFLHLWDPETGGVDDDGAPPLFPLTLLWKHKSLHISVELFVHLPLTHLQTHCLKADWDFF